MILDDDEDGGSMAEASLFNIDTTAIPTAEEEEWATPLVIMTTQTPGHGRGADLYSQRRGATSQQRRMRGCDEINI